MKQKSVFFKEVSSRGGHVLLPEFDKRLQESTPTIYTPICANEHPMKVSEFIGKRFGRLTVLGQTDETPRKNKRWHCRCDCGNEVDVFAGNLLRGRTRSCGCWKSERSTSMHDHMSYQDDTCVERLERVQCEGKRNKTGFRGLFLTKNGKYRAQITFQKKHYTLGYFNSFNDAVQARLQAEDELQVSYLEAFERYEKHAATDPVWADKNPFYFQAFRKDGRFVISTYE